MNEFSDFLNRIRTYSFDKWTLRSPQVNSSKLYTDTIYILSL